MGKAAAHFCRFCVYSDSAASRSWLIDGIPGIPSKGYVFPTAEMEISAAKLWELPSGYVKIAIENDYL